MSARLELVASTPPSCDIPRSIVVKPGETVLFGRAKSSDVVLDSTIAKAMISRTHARLVYDAATGQLTLFDLNSTNGVYVNSRKIDVASLRTGDEITFGGRGRSVPIGQVDPQPQSEFIYRVQVDNPASAEQDEEEEEEAPSTFELLKELTDHVQLLVTWITTTVLAGSYLFAEEGSEELSFAAGYVAPLFNLVGIPFTRLTFTLAFVLGVGILLAAGLAIAKSSQQGKGGKGKAKKKAQ